MKADVMVVGSLSMDLVLQVTRLPKMGETLAGSTFDTFVGGKGNNQAMASARAGAKAAMLGRVGNDEYGRVVMQSLKDNGVICDTMLVDKDVATGIANIWVGPDGDNAIIIVANSNGKLSAADVDNASEAIKAAKLLLLQLEVPIQTVTHAAEVAAANNTLVILNPAPAPPSGKLPEDLLKHVDILIPNETEAEILTGIKPADETSTKACLDALIALGPKSVILTLGERGAVYMSKNMRIKVPSYKVKVVDTTAAGDAFCGALAAKLAELESPKDSLNAKNIDAALRFACAAGAMACTKTGAGPSLPKRDELVSLMS